MSSPQRKGKQDELLAALILSGLADICPWQQAGSKNTITTGLALVSDAASAEVPVSNDIWLLAAPLSCHLHSVARLTYNKQLQAACVLYAAYMLDASFLP